VIEIMKLSITLKIEIEPSFKLLLFGIS